MSKSPLTAASRQALNDDLPQIKPQALPKPEHLADSIFIKTPALKTLSNGKFQAEEQAVDYRAMGYQTAHDWMQAWISGEITRPIIIKQNLTAIIEERARDISRRYLALKPDPAEIPAVITVAPTQVLKAWINYSDKAPIYETISKKAKQLSN